jgi:hypothetical protein
MQVVQLLPGPGPVQGFPAGGGAGSPCLALSQRRLSGSLRYSGLLSAGVTRRFHKTRFADFFSVQDSWIFYICFGAVSDKH